MSENLVDDRILQRLLFVTSDILAPHLQTSQNYTHISILDAYSKIVKDNDTELEYSTANQFLNENQQLQILRNQQQLLSDSPIPSSGSAHALFKDNYTKNPIDMSYIISNYIILFIGDSPFYINIDRLNSDNENLYISKATIKNKSKDAFTLKSNYHITLKVNFTKFDDLLAEKVTAKSVINPQVYTQVPLLKILYRFFDLPTNQAGKQLSDPNGIFLVQTLSRANAENSDHFANLFSDLENPSELSKNYHLTYYKHSFEMFKNEDPIFKYFENELTIEYIAYEADGQEKPISSTTANFVPNINNNLYSLLDKERSAFASLNQAVNIATTFTTLDDLIKDVKYGQDQIDKLLNELSCITADKTDEKEQKQNEIDDYKKNILAHKTKANRMLIFLILNYCQIYRIRIPYELIGIYEVNNFKEALKNNFSFSGLFKALGEGAAISALWAGGTTLLGGAGVAASLGAMVGAITAPALLLAGAGYLAYVLISSALSTKIIDQSKSLDHTRNTIRKITEPGLQQRNTSPDSNFTVEVKDKFLNLAVGGTLQQPNLVTIIKPTYQSEIRKIQDMGTDTFKKVMEETSKIVIPSNTDPELKADIYFTTFGEIMKILTALSGNKLKIISGGYLIDTNIANKEASYCNFSTIPITINSLSKFLYKFIEETDRNMHYDTELFFRDCYENLIKSIITDGQTKLPSLKNSAPRNIKVVSTIHVEKEDSDIKFLKNTNLLEQNSFENLKKGFIKTKNFNFTNNKGGAQKLYKIYVIGTHDEIKYYDFYDAYITWASTNNKKNKRLNYNCDEFQEFINKEHLMPCLMIKSVSDSESILKKKYVSFSRIDNPNLNTGNMLNGSGQMRYPYQFRADFKIFMSFFSDIGSLMFVCPPIANFQSTTNMFGFGGLYIVKSAELEYNFQRIQDGKLTIPNMESKYSLEAYMISHGDSIRNYQQDKLEEATIKKQQECAQPTNQSPASKQP